jgi:CheY-like chemotaxis protein
VDSHILVVDDDSAIRRLLTMMLEDEGYEVSSAESGEEALSALESERPALILLDVLLPGIDGWEVLRRLPRAQTPRPPVILLTAGIVQNDRHHEFPDVEVVTKPFDADDLLARVARHVPVRRT